MKSDLIDVAFQISSSFGLLSNRFLFYEVDVNCAIIPLMFSIRFPYVQHAVAMVKLFLNIVANVLVRDEFVLKRILKLKFLLGSARVVFFELLGRAMLHQRGTSIILCTITYDQAAVFFLLTELFLEFQGSSRRSLCLS